MDKQLHPSFFDGGLGKHRLSQVIDELSFWVNVKA